MVGGKLLVALAQSQRLRRLDESTGAVGQLLNVHAVAPSACSKRPDGTPGTSLINDVRGIPQPRKGREGGISTTCLMKCCLSAFRAILAVADASNSHSLLMARITPSAKFGCRRCVAA